jgi:hypothetical protein
MSNKNCGPDVVKYFVVEPSGGGGSVTGATGDFYVCSGTTFVETISGCDDSVDLNGNTFYNSGEVFFNGIISACTGIHTSNIFGCSPITVHDEIIFLSGETLANIERDDTLTQILARDSVTGKVKYRDVISIITGATSQDTFVTGATLSASTLILSRNDGVELTTDLSSLPITDLGKILFVSETGDDSTGTRGDINKPFRNLYAAKSASTSGDTVYVFPGTWTYDNTATAGKPYDDNVETLVNLWKDGVNYYFSPNSKVIFINQGGPLGGSGGDRMYLFRPSGTQYETCNVYGKLDFETSTVGPNSSGGYSLLFEHGSTTSIYSEGYSCNLEINSAISSANQIMEIGVSTTANTTTYFNLTADRIDVDFIAGQSGNGGAISVVGDGKFEGSLKLNTLNSWLYGFYNRTYTTFTDFSDFKLSVDIDTVNPPTSIRNINFKGESHYNIKDSAPNDLFYLAQGATAGVTKITANIYNDNNSSTLSLFGINSSLDNTTIFNGNIFMDKDSGGDKQIIYSVNDNSTIFFDANVTYVGSASTSQTMFNMWGGTLNLECNVLGTFDNQIINNRNGNVVLSDCNFTSTVTGATLLGNDVTTSTGTTSIRNSTFILDNSVNDLCNGQYLNTYILNSNIKNRGTSDIFTNSTNTGLLQVNNSNLVTNGGNTINISGNSPLIAANLISNTPVIANNISGIITELTELDIE